MFMRLLERNKSFKKLICCIPCESVGTRAGAHYTCLATFVYVNLWRSQTGIATSQTHAKVFTEKVAT